MVFIGIPFVVRTVQPVLIDLDPEIEEAAASLGASRWHTVFAGDPAEPAAGAAHRLCAGLRARGRRIRLGDLHRRQPAERLGDRAAADRDPAVGIPLCRRHRDRRGHAGGVVPDHLRQSIACSAGRRPAFRRIEGRCRRNRAWRLDDADSLCSTADHRDAACTRGGRRQTLASPQDLRTEPVPIRFIIIALAVTFLTVFVVLPLVVVFASGLLQGRRRLFRRARRAGGAVGDQADAAGRGDLGHPQSGLRRDRRLGDREIRFRRQDLPDHADRPAVLGQPGDLRPRVRAAVRRAGLSRALAAGATTSTSCSRCPASRSRPSS